MSHASCPTLDECKRIAALLEKTQAELERRTAWSNEQIAERDRALALAEMERDDAELRERHLEAELRKYEPSDGVMQQQLAFIEAIREAGDLLELYAPPAIMPRVRAWLELPVVRSARRKVSDPENTLPMWTICFGATDMPAGVYRVRRCIIGPGTIAHDEECADYPSLEAARLPLVERGLCNIHRNYSDAPHIVECWI